MDSKSKSSEARRTYEEFQLLTNWRREEQVDTVAINLPGYEKQQLKIFLDNTGKMKISGERPVGHDNQWQRFRVDLQTHEASDLNAIRAKFDKGILTVTIPKTTTTPTKPKEPPSTTQPTEATAPLICRPKSDGGFLYQHRKAAMGMVLAATALTGGIYVLYKIEEFRVQHGK